MTRCSAALRRALLMTIVAAVPAAAQHTALTEAPRFGPLRAASYAAPRPHAPRVTLLPGLANTRDRGGGSGLVTTVLLLGAGVGMVVGGRELEGSLGFPGAIVRYTGYAVATAGVFSLCGCL